MPSDSIDSARVRDALAPIWLEIPDTSRRILQRITAVLDFAHIKGMRPEEALAQLILDKIETIYRRTVFLESGAKQKAVNRRS